MYIEMGIKRSAHVPQPVVDVESRNQELIPISDERILNILGLDSLSPEGLPTVTIDTALGVPAIAAAVNFLSRTLAGLTLKVYSQDSNGRKEITTGAVPGLLQHAANDELTAFMWRKCLFESVFTEGRSLSYIEKRRGKPLNIFPLPMADTVLKRKNHKTTYHYRENSAGAGLSNGRQVDYRADEVLDMAFMLGPDGLRHRSPITMHRTTIALMIAANDYGAKFFNNGGIPSFVVTGKVQSGAAIQRMSNDVHTAIRQQLVNGRNGIALPENHELKPLGLEPEKLQMVEVQVFNIQQAARIFGLPPVFLHDLSHGNFTNTEQQDLQLTKHTLKHWTEQFEQELSLKLYGRKGNRNIVEHDFENLLRGDYKGRMEGNALAIQSAQRTPNEVRARDNLPPITGGDELYIQGANAPLKTQMNLQLGVPDGASEE